MNSGECKREAMSKATERQYNILIKKLIAL